MTTAAAHCTESLLETAAALLPETIALRRALHERPEVGLELPETRRIVLAALADLDLEIVDSKSTSGFIAVLRGGRAGEGGPRRVLLRADMDALPMPEDTLLPFASKNQGAMHACGHDAHTAMLVGAAKLLSARRAELRGDVALLFQPGEEGHFGARQILRDGLLDGDHAPDAIFALHIDPRLSPGHAASRPGPLLASADVWNVEVKGRGGHASMPHNTIDPLPAACEMVTALQTMITRRINAFDPAVLTTTQIHAGTTDNVIPEVARLQGTLRATSEHARQKATEGIGRVVRGVAAAHGVEATIEVLPGYPVTVNEPEFTAFARATTEAVLGEGRYIDLPAPIMGAEDFSYLLERFPGAMLFLGMRDPAIADPDPVHSNRMVLGEEGMASGIALHAGIALRYLAGPEA